MVLTEGLKMPKCVNIERETRLMLCEVTKYYGSYDKIAFKYFSDK